MEYENKIPRTDMSLKPRKLEIANTAKTQFEIQFAFNSRAQEDTFIHQNHVLAKILS